jgi:hypothetical protein
MEIKGRELTGPWNSLVFPDDFRTEGDLSGLVGASNESTKVQIVVPFKSANSPTEIK